MKQHYHNLITDKSYRFLQELREKFDFVLIGGWAVFLYSRALKSKDVDIIIDYSELAKMKEDYEIFKNDRLKKYELKTGEFDVDIYLPHYSDLGIKAEAVVKRVVSREGFAVPEAEMLLLLKLFAWQERRGSAKGQKDELDILSLATLPEFNWKKYMELVKKFDLGVHHKNFVDLLKNIRRAEALGLNEQKMARIRKAVLKKLGK